MTIEIDEIASKLPKDLSERVRHVSNKRNTRGEFVLYWMRSAVRMDENPALDVASFIANQLGLPLLVYHALSERYPYASDRHHTFILQGARDVQAAAREKKIGYAFHLERVGHRGPHLLTLATRAAAVITEDMPVRPLNRWTQHLSRQIPTPLIAVDAACVVPMRLVAKPFDRAYAYRKATEPLYRERLTRPVSSISLDSGVQIAAHLPFEPIDLQTADIAELVSHCDIDHAVGPVPHTPGGSMAGYERWNSFKKQGLAKYDRLRNNALVDGVSRMSPYLHYGMVSPMRIARETAQIKRSGAEKYLDELLIWRELAYCFCFYRSDHERTSALPAWAIETLDDHARDERRELLSWECLARGKTGDELWDAAQRSLLMQGELHNNVRMTWGKSILNWTQDAKSALAKMIDLNHRYALDGRDPASYGGILWCLGQFDRPFPPPRPIFGTVRERSSDQHAKRLDTQAYREHATRPLNHRMPTVAVIGAGISGLMCARTLMDHGFPVTVFEKSRGVGGRMATRRSNGQVGFDHGAQYFTVRDERFRRYVKSWVDDGIVKPWHGRIVALKNGHVTGEKSGTDRFVGVPGMNAICKHLSTDLDVRFQTQVSQLRRRDDTWQVVKDDHIGPEAFDVAIVSAPAAQTARLLREAEPVASAADNCLMHSCWAAMLSFPKSLGLDFEGAFVHDSPLSWICCNSSKPGRNGDAESWVLHASAEWTHDHLEDSSENVEESLTNAFWEAIGIRPTNTNHRVAHRWRYALPPEPLAESCLFDAELQVAACGDWCAGPRVEGAFLSGAAAAGRVMGLLKTEQATTVALEKQQMLF